MSEEINPDAIKASDVAAEEMQTPAPKEEVSLSEKAGEIVDKAAEKVEDLAAEAVNYGEKTLAELTGMFEGLMEDVDRLKKSKEAEAIKAAFY
ncbi:MAG: hypothetical protein IJ795_03600, partial [Bacteroidales bacterium]|nr:hypothetical protein [Bacteroidales bacterium]